MTKTKLEIIGPYTPEHEGPFAWILGYPKKCLVHSIVKGVAFITVDGKGKPFSTNACFIRNAREVPVAREFWLNEFRQGDAFVSISNKVEHSEMLDHAWDAAKKLEASL